MENEEHNALAQVIDIGHFHATSDECKCGFSLKNAMMTTI